MSPLTAVTVTFGTVEGVGGECHMSRSFMLYQNVPRQQKKTAKTYYRLPFIERQEALADMLDLPHHTS